MIVLLSYSMTTKVPKVFWILLEQDKITEKPKTENSKYKKKKLKSFFKTRFDIISVLNVYFH